jgi:hypothetical protein
MHSFLFAGFLLILFLGHVRAQVINFLFDIYALAVITDFKNLVPLLLVISVIRYFLCSPPIFVELNY